MNTAEWRDFFRDVVPPNAVWDILNDLEALESFCEGLKGVNDELRGKISELVARHEARLDEAGLVKREKLETAEKALIEADKPCLAWIKRAESAEARCKRLLSVLQALEEDEPDFVHAYIDADQMAKEACDE